MLDIGEIIPDIRLGVLHRWLFGVGFKHLLGETDHFKSAGTAGENGAIVGLQD